MVNSWYSLAAVSSRTGIPVVIVRLEFNPDPRNPIETAVERRARALGLHYVDTRDAFAGIRSTDLWIYALNRHPNARANRISMSSSTTA